MVKTYDSTGNYSEAFYYPVERKELTLDHVLEIYQGTDENSYVKNEREKVLRNINLPQYWPAVESLLVDDENRLWISTIVEDFDIYEWWVLEERGELITKFEWARDEPIEVVKNGFMYTRQTDEETGLQQVVRYRIEMELI